MVVKRKKSEKVKKMINSYILAHKDNPYEDLKLLRRYLQKKQGVKLKLERLRDMVKNQLKKEKRSKNIGEIEAKLFTRDGNPREYKYGSAFCDNCYMYKDHQKECPYCGDVELTR